MKLFMVPAVVGLLALPGVVLAAPAPERIRGTIDAVDAGSMTVHTIDGTTATIALNKETKVVSLVKSSLSAIMDGSFVGTATKGDNPPTALEIHIFPEAMRGTGEGHRDWDTIPDTLAGGGRVKSAMTNGTVKASAAPAPRVKSAMTNGTVSKNSAANGEQMLTLTYGNGESKTVAVSPRTPIVSYEPADQSAIRPGAKVFVTAERDGDKLTAVRAAVGKDGVTPPM
ncbi:metal ABC transporter permease [Methylobacterium phyllosphaerae]